MEKTATQLALMWCHYEYIMNIYLAAKFNIAHNWYEQFYLFSSWNLVVFCCYMHLWLTVGIIMLFECVSHIIGHTYGSCFNSGRFFSFRWAMIRVHRPVSSWWLQMPCCQICAGTSTTALPTTAMQPESCHNHLTHCGREDLWKGAIFTTILTSTKSWLSQEDLEAGCEYSLVPMDS